MTTPLEQLPTTRRAVPPVLVYWHCEAWWPLSEGAVCPLEHDTPIYDYRPRKGRKLAAVTAWICSGLHSPNPFGELVGLARTRRT